MITEWQKCKINFAHFWVKLPIKGAEMSCMNGPDANKRPIFVLSLFISFIFHFWISLSRKRVLSKVKLFSITILVSYLKLIENDWFGHRVIWLFVCKLPKTSAGVKRLRVDAQEMILARSISPDARVWLRFNNSYN